MPPMGGITGMQMPMHAPTMAMPAQMPAMSAAPITSYVPQAEPSYAAPQQLSYLPPVQAPAPAMTSYTPPTYAPPSYAQPSYAQPTYAQPTSYAQPSYTT